MDKYADTMAVIANMAKVKLAMNSHKGNIEDMEADEIFRLLRGEVDELGEATELLHTIEEAADVFNFLLALVHKKVETYRNRHNDSTTECPTCQTYAALDIGKHDKDPKRSRTSV